MAHHNEAPPPDHSDAEGVAGKNFSSPTRPAGGVALEKAIQFMTWLVPTLEAFPRSQKFLLGDRLQGLALDLIERLIEATYSKAPQNALREA